MKYLLDTHIWVWQAEANPRLPPRIRRRLDATRGLLALSPISAWEVHLLSQRGRIEIPGPIGGWVAKHRAPYAEAPLTFDVIDTLRTLDVTGFDPADSLLAATAVTYGLALVTLDRRLASLDGLRTWP